MLAVGLDLWAARALAAPVAPAVVGGAALLVGETNGFATDFTCATDAQRVAIKTAGTVVEKGLDSHYLSTGTSPKQVVDVSGALVWAPHNMMPQSAGGRPGFLWAGGGSTKTTSAEIDPNGGTEALQVVVTTASTGHNAFSQPTGAVIGATYTASMWVKGTASQQIYQSVDSAASAAQQTLVTFTGAWQRVLKTFVGTTNTPYLSWECFNRSGGAHLPLVTFHVWGGEYVRGSTASPTHVPTVGTARMGLAVDYMPSAAWVYEPAATNLLLNSTTLSTQNVSVSAQAYTLSFFGTGTITLSGASTAGPLVGTGANNRVFLTFTPTPALLTLTVSGTVSNAQFETGTYPTSPIPTLGATVTRAADNYSFLLSTIPPLGAEYSIYVRGTCPSNGGSRYMVNVGDGTAAEHAGLRFQANYNLGVTDNSVAVGAINQVSPLPTYGVVASMAARFKLNDCALSGAGGAMSVGNGSYDTSVTMPTVTEVRFGGNGTGAVTQLYRIEKLVIVTPSWNDATLATKSAA